MLTQLSPTLPSQSQRYNITRVRAFYDAWCMHGRQTNILRKMPANGKKKNYSSTARRRSALNNEACCRRGQPLQSAEPPFPTPSSSSVPHRGNSVTAAVAFIQHFFTTFLYVFTLLPRNQKTKTWSNHIVKFQCAHYILMSLGLEQQADN